MLIHNCKMNFRKGRISWRRTSRKSSATRRRGRTSRPSSRARAEQALLQEARRSRHHQPTRPLHEAKKDLGAAAEVLEKKHNISDFASAKALLPPAGAGTGLYKAKDGRWKIQMPNLANDGPRTRSFSSSWSVRSDTESWKFLLAEAWHFYKTNGGEAEAPSL